MFQNYFKIALRNLSRNKVYSVINILGLSLGLACAMLIILYTKDELSYDRFHTNVDRMYRIGMIRVNPDGGEVGKGGYTGYFQGPRFTAGIPEIQSFVRLQSGSRDMKLGTEIVGRDLLMVDSNFFSFFSLPLISGNPKTVLLKPRSVVISEKLAIEQFGNTDALGKTLLIKDDEQFVPYEVTGIAKKSPQNSSVKFDMLLPIVVSKEDEQRNENWFNFFLNSFVMLSPGADVKKVEAKMKQVYENDAKESIKLVAEKYGDRAVTTYNLQPFADMHLSKDYPPDNGLSDASNPMYSYILTGIAFFILLIACINFVNLTIARSLKRAKEIGIRKVVGGERRQLIAQFLGESFLLCFGAFALAIVIVQLVLPTFNRLSNKALSLSYLLDVKLVGGYILLFFITGLLAGFYPALVLSSYNPVQTLYSRFNLGGKNYLQRGLVILQFSLATILIVATITIYNQFNYLTHKDLGYDDHNVVGFNRWGMKRSDAELLKRELMSNPKIVGVAPKNGGRWGTVAKVNGELQINFQYETVDESYLPFFNIPVIKGRNFSTEYPSDSTHSVLVNETFVKKAGWKEPLGQEVNFWYDNNRKYTVIGVVKDYHFLALNQEIMPQLFTMKPENEFGIVFVKIKDGAQTSALQHIQKTFKKFFPTSPYVYKFLDQENVRQYEAEAKWKQMMLFGAVLTIFISCIGLFGLSVLSAEKRTKEIGIRKVLGASVSGVVTILSKDFLKLVVIAMLIAMPAAWYFTNRWLENYPYRIHLAWWMFAFAGLLVILVALITVSFQALKAAVANPVKSLRTE